MGSIWVIETGRGACEARENFVVRAKYFPLETKAINTNKYDNNKW